MPTYKPRILLLADVLNWAFDVSAKQIARKLQQDFDFEIQYSRLKPQLDPSAYDLVFIFFWGETCYQKFGFEPLQIIKEVSSHRWEDDPRYGPCTPSEFAEKYLSDCNSVACVSSRLYRMLERYHPHVYHVKLGFDPNLSMARKRSGRLTIGWAGNAQDPLKGYQDILKPACENRFKLLAAEGNVSRRRMNRFYNRLDVFAVASRHEGQPLTLLESMAAGCFPVIPDIGIVPELIRHEVNGYIVPNRTKEEYVQAFKWCERNLEKIRRAGSENAAYMAQERNWDICAQTFKRVLADAYDRASRPRFRNDDVSCDTPFHYFEQFSEVFHKYGWSQMHGIVLRGFCTTRFTDADNNASEYEGYPTLSKLDNSMIRKLSDSKNFEDRNDLIRYINDGPDQIALHGLYHTDYSKMSYEEQRADITEGLNTLKRLFPHKRIGCFIPPFNRANENTYRICHDLHLRVLTTEGRHLEADLDNLVLKRNTWYRYHHHRFYPGSSFNYYRLSFDLLDQALARNLEWSKNPDTYTTEKRSTSSSRFRRIFKRAIKS